MEKLENGMFVICPEGDVASYLTSGKKYEVFDVHKEFEGYSFLIKNDNGDSIFCVMHPKKCSEHLNGKHWIIDFFDEVPNLFVTLAQQIQYESNINGLDMKMITECFNQLQEAYKKERAYCAKLNFNPEKL